MDEFNGEYDDLINDYAEDKTDNNLRKMCIDNEFIFHFLIF
jgi:hypothetical protein